MIKPDLLINGTDIVSTLATGVHFGRPLSAGGYTHASGTSMATPQVAAIGALLLEAAGKHGVTLDPAAMKSILTRAAKAIPDVVPAWQGAGILTAASALAVFDQDYGDEPAPVQTPLQVRIEFNGELRKGARIEGRLTVTNSSATPIEALRVNVGGEGVRVETSGADAISADGLAPHAYVTGELAVTPSAAGTLTLLIQGSYRRGEGAAEHGVIREVHQEQVQDVAGPLTISRVRSVTAKACELLLARQRPAGMWAGDIMFNAWTNGMYCILYKVLGLKGTPSSALTWLENHRSGLDETGASDGTFGIVDDPSIHMLEASIVSQVALEIWGRPRDQRVWDFIDALSAARLASAISNADPFTQLFISMASPYRPAGVEPYYSINDIMIPPIELLAIPGFVGASVPNLFAAWGLDAITALAATGVMVREPNPTFPHRVLCAKAERQLLRNQRPDGSWYGTILPTFACTFAMHALGYPNEHPVMQAAFAFIHGQLRADGYLVRYELPVWDTALSILALRQAGYPKNDARLLKGADYLLASQAPNGGVPFKRENSIYPDTDDTAFAILALAALDHPDPGGVARYTERGLEWLLYMQGKTGGWAAFSKDQSEKSPARAPVFKDDPPTADVTAHVLSSLKLATGNRWGKRILDARQRGFDWLLSQQLAKGGFYGRWGMTVTYGTVAVLQAVEDLGERPDQRFVIAGVDCLLRMQKPDGGWGEGFRTYYDVNATESVPSTVEQTAWTVLGLLSVPLTEASRAAVDRGVSYLLERFDELQGWGGGTYSVGALWIYKHSLYPLAWPIWALAKYIQIIGRDQ
jgi:squalene cyclase